VRDSSQSHAPKNAEALSKSHHNLLPYAREYKDNEMSIRFLHSVHLVLIVIHNKNRYNLAYIIVGKKVVVIGLYHLFINNSSLTVKKVTSLFSVAVSPFDIPLLI